MLLTEKQAENTISRFETGVQTPSYGTFNEIMDIMDVPTDAFFQPFMDGVGLEMYLLRDHIFHCLEWAEEDQSMLETAKTLLGQMQTMGDFTDGINLQVVLSIQACIDILEGANSNDIIAMAKKGIALSYPEYDYNAPGNHVLLFEEAELIYTIARATAKIDPTAAIEQLEKILAGLDLLPADDRDKERYQSRVLLSLAQLLVQTGQYPKALEICDKGIPMSIQRNKSKHVPDFAYQKAIALVADGRKEEAMPLLKPMYCAFIGMRKRKKADLVLQLAEKIGITLEIQGAEHLPTSLPKMEYSYGKPIPANSIGDLLRKLCAADKINLKELSRGVCSISALSRIMDGKLPGDVYFLEVFMQRLGRDINKYYYTFLGNNEFAGKQMRDRIRMLMVMGQHDEAIQLMEELKAHKDYKKGINLQYIAYQEAHIHAVRIGRDAKHLEMLKKAWAMTKDDFDTMGGRYIATTRLSNYELVIANMIANNLCRNGERPKGIRIYESLLANMDNYYVDESEKMRMYFVVLFNYSNELEHVGRDRDAIASALKGEELCLKHGNLTALGGFMSNRACAMYNLDEKEKSLPFFIVDYYISVLLGKKDDQVTIKKYIKENFNIDID